MFAVVPEEYWVLDPRVVHELDDLVEEDAGGGDSHPVGDGKHRPNLVHGVPRIEKIENKYKILDSKEEGPT